MVLKAHLLYDSDTYYLYNTLFDTGKFGIEFLYFDKSDSLFEKLSKLGYLNTGVLYSNSKGLPSKI